MEVRKLEEYPKKQTGNSDRHLKFIGICSNLNAWSIELYENYSYIFISI